MQDFVDIAKIVGVAFAILGAGLTHLLYFTRKQNKLSYDVDNLAKKMDENDEKLTKIKYRRLLKWHKKESESLTPKE